MKKKTLEELLADANAQVVAWNTAMFEKKYDIAREADKSLADLEKEYLVEQQSAVFAALASEENPMLAAIKKLTFTIIKHNDKTDKDRDLTTRELITKDRQIDLLRFDEYCSKANKAEIAHDPLWQYKVQCFNQLMCLRSARELKIDPKAISDSYYIAEKAKEIDMGKTPDSNSSILKALQSCIDAIIFVDDGKGKNTYKASSHDVAYLLMTYTRKGKTALSVATANHSTMRNFVSVICHRVVTGESYTIEYKEDKKAAKKEETKVA